MDLFEAIQSQRAIRKFKSDPVPEESIRKVLEAAIRAPSGGNRQPWSFIVVRGAELKRQMGELYRECADELLATAPFYARAFNDPDSDPATRRMMQSSRYLVEHFTDVPVFIVACMAADGPSPGLTCGASIYPAVQNILLSARALGLGATLTTIHRYRHDAFCRLLGIPPDRLVAAIIPLGFPEGRFGSGPRRPLSEVAFAEVWGKPL